MNTILGPNPNDGKGNDLIGSITIRPDYPDPNNNNVMSCRTSNDIAELREWWTPNPQMVLCNAAFTHGGIGKGYGLLPIWPFGVPAVACGNFDPEVSWKMDTLGATLLHEYTHYLNLVGPPGGAGPLPRETDDIAYGPYNVRNMDKTQATKNGDSYNWFATENLWTVICQKQYTDPAAPDSIDPGCGQGICQALKGVFTGS